jgi:hypothetical protein
MTRFIRPSVVAIVFVGGLGLFASRAAAQESGSVTATDAQIREELVKLRQELDAIRNAYEARLAALESRLAGMAGAQGAALAQPPAPAPAAAQPTEAPVPAGAAGAGGPQGALPVYGGASALSKIFNPDIAVIGNFLGAVGENPVDPAPALELNEAEASLQAVVDPYARADFFLAFSPEGVEIEEAFLTFPTLPGGLLAKVGRLKQQVGKANTFHAHNQPWVDSPLAVQNLLGGEEGLIDSGVSVSRLIMNPWIFLEATGEVYQGSSGVFASESRGDLSYVGRLRAYRDLTEATNLDVGTSFAWGRNDAGPDLSTRILALDTTFRYRPLRGPSYRRFVGRGEFFWSRREEEEGARAAFGLYASGEYQFARRWFAGGRYDWSERADAPSLVDKGPSLLVTFWPSEFSQIRGQYRRIRFGEGVTSNEVLFQFLFSIGAHGAHAF